MVSNDTDLVLSPEEIDKRIKERVTGENKYYVRIFFFFFFFLSNIPIPKSISLSLPLSINNYSFIIIININNYSFIFHSRMGRLMLVCSTSLNSPASSLLRRLVLVLLPTLLLSSRVERLEQTTKGTSHIIPWKKQKEKKRKKKIIKLKKKKKKKKNYVFVHTHIIRVKGLTTGQLNLVCLHCTPIIPQCRTAFIKNRIKIIDLVPVSIDYPIGNVFTATRRTLGGA